MKHHSTTKRERNTYKEGECTTNHGKTRNPKRRRKMR